MKYLVPLFLVCCTLCYGQSETFDLATYVVPTGWTKSNNTANVVGYEIANKQTGGFAKIGIYKSIASGSNGEVNFAADWQALVVDSFHPSSKPEMVSPVVKDGWEIRSGVAPFQHGNTQTLAMIITMTGYDVRMTILILANSNEFKSSIDNFIDSIELKKPGKINQSNSTTKSTSAYTYTTTNFDDGWISNAREDWVEVTKGNLKVLVHYPNPKADEYNSVLKDGLYNAWNILVAPRYRNIQNLELKPIQSWESVVFAEADAIETATGRNVHIVHYSKGNGRYIEIVSTGKAAYEQEFGAYHNDEFGWDKYANMQWRNKFAVADADLVGTWSANDYASLSYYYVSSGGYAGATATSTAHEFTFNANGSYRSDHAGASGVVGSQKFSRQVYTGNYRSENWTVTLTNRFQGQSEKYDCYFESIKGGRILILTDRNNTVYSLIKK